MEVQAPMTADALRDARKAAGISQEELAAVLGVHYRTYQRWEAGEVPIRPSMAQLLRHTLPFPTSQRAPELRMIGEGIIGADEVIESVTVHIGPRPD